MPIFSLSPSIHGNTRLEEVYYISHNIRGEADDLYLWHPIFGPKIP